MVWKDEPRAVNYPPHREMMRKAAAQYRGDEDHFDSQEYYIKADDYRCPEHFERELKGLFRDLPLAVARVDQLAGDNNCLALDIAGLPVLITRNPTGRIQCFINACRHRGARLLDSEHTCHKRNLVCPFHHWTYDLDGNLISIPLDHGFPQLDWKNHGLRPLPTVVRHGFIWVTPNVKGTKEFEQFLGDFDEDLVQSGIAEYRYFRQRGYHVNANWKMLMDAFYEAYHVQRLHKQSLGDYFSHDLGHFEAVGRHVRSAVVRKELEAELDMPPEQWDRDKHFTFTLYCSPNSAFIFSPHYCTHLALYPISVGETRASMCLLTAIKSETEEDMRHWESTFDLLEKKVFANEDFNISESAQSTLGSMANEHLIAGRFEKGIRLFHQSLDRTMGRNTL